MSTPALDIATRDRIAADALRWAADRFDPGPRATRPQPIDETHNITMSAARGAATNLRFWADQVERGSIEPRPAGSASHVTVADHPHTDPGDGRTEVNEPDDGLTCSPCKEWRCDECEGGSCWHECPDEDRATHEAVKP